MTAFPRVNILGVGISAITRDDAGDAIAGWIASRDPHYVNVCTVHTVMECQKDPGLRHMVNASGLATPDGMPLVWLSKLRGYRRTERVYGPDLMLAVCERGLATGYRHFLYGAHPASRTFCPRSSARVIRGLWSLARNAPPYRPAGTQRGA